MPLDPPNLGVLESDHNDGEGDVYLLLSSLILKDVVLRQVKLMDNTL